MSRRHRSVGSTGIIPPGPPGTRDDIFPAGSAAAEGKVGAESAGSKTSDYRSYIERSLRPRRQRCLHAGAIRSGLRER